MNTPRFADSVRPHTRKAIVLRVFPKMGVAVVRLPDGQVRTVKLDSLAGVNSPKSLVTQARMVRKGTPPRAAVPHVPSMGRNMTADAPAVRRVQTQAQPVPGQAPEVKVKQENPQVQAALAQPPAAVSPEESARLAGWTRKLEGRFSSPAIVCCKTSVWLPMQRPT